MKLTKEMKSAMIAAIMEDIPKVDYDRQIFDAACKSIVGRLPEKLKAVFEDKNLCVYIKHEQATTELMDNLKKMGRPK